MTSGFTTPQNLECEGPPLAATFLPFESLRSIVRSSALLA